ncbi:hypothetical protein K2X33_14610 [bacterium]|nr:hypothetical protein [bacterium]
MKTLLLSLVAVPFLIAYAMPSKNTDTTASGAGCQGPVYAFDPTCASNCPPAECQDVSFGQDGSEYQCCE